MIDVDSNFFDTEEDAASFINENAREGERWFVFETKQSVNNNP